jgi:hypothetical protein
MKSKRTSVTMEEVEDEENRLYRMKPKLAADSKYVLEEVHKHQQKTGDNKKKDRKDTIPTKSKVERGPKTQINPNKDSRDMKDIPVRYGRKVKDHMKCDIESNYGPSLHTRYAYQGIDRTTGEVLLAQLEAALVDTRYEPP